ncbi:MAG: hypothetical protein N2C14_31540 [Planctomycetales bacterium]
MMNASPRNRPEPQRRIILLGASNLTRGVSTIVEIARQTWGEPLDVMAALGHGRSYGLRSSVLYRTLPGIVHCNLWNDLRTRPPLPTAALITDVGNDLIYEQPVEAVVPWVETCLDRLEQVDAAAVMTLLPVEVLPSVQPWQFLTFRTIAFPTSRITFEEITARALQLNLELRRIAAERNLPVIEHDAQWYGLDPIHIKLRFWPAAWSRVLSTWSPERESPDPPRGSLPRWLYLRSLLPDQRWVLGLSQRRDQPVGGLRDGTLISYY